MKLLKPNEIKLVGKMIVDGNQVRGDETMERINWLVSKVLKRIGISKDGGAWRILYQDPADGRYWVKEYPQSEMHGGGAPALVCISGGEVGNAFNLEDGVMINIPLRPFENRLIGATIVEKVGGEAVAEDEVTKRVKWLISKVLKKIATSIKTTESKTLYSDPMDGRYWVLTLQHGDVKVPELNCISIIEAKRDFKF